MKYLICLLLSLVCSIALAIDVRPIPGSQLGLPLVAETSATFQLVRPYVVGMGKSDVQEFDLHVDPPGHWTIEVSGASYGSGNQNRLLAKGTTLVDNTITTGIGPWSQSISVTVTPLEGDYNNDGIVGAADYTLWRNLGAPRAAYNAMRANYGAISLPILDIAVAGLPEGYQPPNIGVQRLVLTYVGPLAVPEPRTMSLVLFGLLIIGFILVFARRITK